MDLKEKRDIMAAILMNRMIGERVAMLSSEEPGEIDKAVDRFNPFIKAVYRMVDLMIAEGGGKI